MSLEENIAKILPKVITALNQENADIEKVISDTYEVLTAEYQPAIIAMPIIINKLLSDSMPIINAFYSAASVKVREDENIQETMKRNNELKATQRFNQLKAYQKAGFTRTEAMELLFQDIANVKTRLQQLPFDKKLPKSKTV